MMNDSGVASPARQEVENLLLPRQKLLQRTAENWAAHVHGTDSWPRRALIVANLNEQLRSLQSKGTYKIIRDGALHEER